MRAAPAVPGYEPAETDLMVVSLSGTRGLDPSAVRLEWGPPDVVGAWHE
jgi:hypothetical protein